MSKKRLGNLFKRKLSLNLKELFLGEKNERMGGLRDIRDMREGKREWIKSQFRDFSKLGGELVVMKMGN